MVGFLGVVVIYVQMYGVGWLFCSGVSFWLMAMRFSKVGMCPASVVRILVVLAGLVKVFDVSFLPLGCWF